MTGYESDGGIEIKEIKSGADPGVVRVVRSNPLK